MFFFGLWCVVLSLIVCWFFFLVSFIGYALTIQILLNTVLLLTVSKPIQWPFTKTVTTNENACYTRLHQSNGHLPKQ